MNVLKHMEAVFVATLVLAVSASSMLDAIPEAVAAAPVSVSASAPAATVVTVSAKRMTAAEKARSLHEEQLASNAARPANRM